MEPGKRKKIKTEEAMGKDVIVEVYLERIKDLGEEIRGFKLQSWMDKETIKEISLKNSEANQTVEELSRKLSACEHAKKMSDWIQEDMKRRELENLRCVEDLRRKNLEASRCVEELRRQMLAYEEEKKTASRVQDVRELENLQCVEDLRQQNLKSNRKVEELRSRILAFEEDKKTSNLVLEEMKTREMENFRCLEDLRRKNSEADRKVEELGDRVSSLEEENRTAVRVREEMKLREMDSERRLEGLERQKLEADKRMNEMKVRESDLRQQLLKADDRVKEMEGRSLEDLRRKKLEAYRCVEELQRLILAYEEGKKMASRVQEVRELENLQCVEDLKRQNLESNRKVEELRSRVLAFEEDKKTSNLVLEEMKTRETENFRCLEELRRKNSEADRKVEEFGDRVSAFEEENRTALRVWEEMKVRETDSERRLEGLERQKLEADRRMNEMKVRESDLRRQILEADDRVKEMEGRSLEACKKAEENIKRFENVLPIAEDLWKLLKMNVDDLVSVKEKFVRGVDENVLISSSVVSGNSRNGAAVISGPHARNKEELTVSATEQPTKKRKTNKSLIKRKWIFGADMVRAFEEDDELCLHAVCALYRQHVSTSQSTESSNKLFYHFEALRGVAFAEYLINGDPELILTRQVDEVKQKNPDIVNQCRRLAIYYSSYFTALPRTNEPLSRSLTLVCCHRYAPSTHPYGCMWNVCERVN